MATPLANIDRLAARLGEPITAAEDVLLAEEMLEAASAEVRFYGLPWEDPATAPPAAVNIVLAAALRGYMNPGGFTRERMDAATFDRHDDYSRGVELTASEKARLKQLTGVGGIRSVGISNPDQFVSRDDARCKNQPWFYAYDWANYSEAQLLRDMGRLP